MRFLISTATISVIVFLIGCASIINGKTQQISITSDPPEAQVAIDDADRGTTPLSMELSRKDRHTITVKLSGYKTQEIALDRKVSGWVWGNIIFGGLIGLAVDAISGGMYKITPETVNARLTPVEDNTQAGANDRVLIRVVMRPDPRWEKIGQLQPAD